ncbi:hypothetical protein Tco_1499000 [Tanacetum coccineum]
MFRDKKGAENLAADHHSKTGKSLHQDNSRTMEIMKHFLSKSLGSIALKDESTPWFADLLQTSHAKVITELAGQFDNASTAKDDLRKAYEKGNDIPQENLGSCHKGIEILEFSPEKALWRTPSLLPLPSAIYLNGALHWLKLEDIMDGLMHFKLNIEDHDHPILTSIKIHQGLHRVRYLVNTDDFMNPLPEGWSTWSTVWSIVLGEREENSCLVINLSGKMLIMPFGADHNVYEFIPSSASV